MSLEKTGSDAYLHDDPPPYGAHNFSLDLLGKGSTQKRKLQRAADHVRCVCCSNDTQNSGRRRCMSSNPHLCSERDTATTAIMPLSSDEATFSGFYLAVVGLVLSILFPGVTVPNAWRFFRRWWFGEPTRSAELAAELTQVKKELADARAGAQAETVRANTAEALALAETRRADGAERRETEANRRADEGNRRADEGNRRADEGNRRADEANRRADEANRRADEAHGGLVELMRGYERHVKYSHTINNMGINLVKDVLKMGSSS